jgi:hypothetical protein
MDVGAATETEADFFAGNPEAMRIRWPEPEVEEDVHTDTRYGHGVSGDESVAPPLRGVEAAEHGPPKEPVGNRGARQRHRRDRRQGKEKGSSRGRSLLSPKRGTATAKGGGMAEVGSRSTEATSSSHHSQTAVAAASSQVAAPLSRPAVAVEDICVPLGADRPPQCGRVVHVRATNTDRRRGPDAEDQPRGAGASGSSGGGRGSGSRGGSTSGAKGGVEGGPGLHDVWCTETVPWLDPSAPARIGVGLDLANALAAIHALDLPVGGTVGSAHELWGKSRLKTSLRLFFSFTRTLFEMVQRSAVSVCSR